MKSILFLLIATVFYQGAVLYAQAPQQMDTEIQRLERVISSGGSPAERHNTIVRLAGLKQLSGDLAGAAEAWLEAVKENPGDEEASISAAFCLAATGEWEKAASALYPLLTSSSRGQAVQKAFFLDACLKARLSKDVSALVSLASDMGFLELRPLIYFALWQVNSSNAAADADSWKKKLLAEFPKSPEALVVSEGLSKGIGLTFNPFWLFIPGAVLSFSNLPPERPQIPPVQTAVSGQMLQAGVFSNEFNARKQIEALSKAGFTGTISPKKVNGVDHWAVIVPAGSDPSLRIQELKKAGFDSFLIR